jgi:glycine C-acetyltransferase
LYGTLRDDLKTRLAEVRDAGTYKTELVMTTPQGAHVDVEGRGELLNLCANNYLGLANHPSVVAAAHEALDRWGYGMASVRFICGTQALHRELEERLSAFLGTDDTILFSSCFDANGGLFEALLTDEDAVISDQLNHASIIDGIRLCKAQRLRYANGDMDELEARLVEAAGARRRLIATDGVFSMDGHIARLGEICDLAERHDAMVMVDDSHATGFIGKTGRGTPEHCGVMNRIDVMTGTLGKALGGGSGGYTVGKKEAIALLRQRSRPYLFSNTLAPAIVGASLKVFELLGKTTELRDKSEANTKRFREGLTKAGVPIKEGIHPIVPVMLGDAKLSQEFAAAMLEEGIFVIGFFFPVVPKGQARIRVQISAAHTFDQIDRAIAAFAKVGKKLGVVPG